MWSNCDDCGGWAWRPVPFDYAMERMSGEEVDTAPLLIFGEDVQAFICGVCGALGFRLIEEKVS